MCKISELYCKEVICLRSGQRLGFITDVRIELPCGKITGVIVPGRCRMFGVCPPREDYLIPWECIRRIGPDLILVDVKPEDCCVPRARGILPF